jgi:hypothetical protein
MPDLVAVSTHLEALLSVPPLIRINGKRPLDRSWSSGPRRDPVGWRRRLRDHDGNIGLLTGEGLVVVDVDLYVPGAEDSIDELHRLGLDRYTVTCLSGGGGRHLYYTTPVPVPSRPLDGFVGIDVKGEGGMVVVPPSTHPDTGRLYEWEFGFAPGDVERSLVPANVLDLLGAGRAHAASPLDERDETAVNVLVDHFGGHHPRQRDGYVEVTRPGKPDGASATVGAVGRGTTRVWSSNWPGLPAGVYGLVELRRRAGVDEPHRFNIPEAVGLRWQAFSTVQMRAVRWLWTGRIPLGGVCLLIGREGTGKGILASWLAASVTRGSLPGALTKPRRVLWLSTEDSITFTLKPRLEAAGADVSRVGFVSLDGEDASHLAAERLDEVTAIVRDHNVALVVCDPLISLLPIRLDAHKEQHVRAGLTPLKELADSTGAAVLGIGHFGKGHQGDPLTAVLGSRAFTALARCMLSVGYDPDEDLPSTRIVVVEKSNLGTLEVPGFAYTVQGKLVGHDSDGEPIIPGLLVPLGELDHPPSGAALMRFGEGVSRTMKDEAVEFLKGMLGGGEVLATEVKAAADREEITKKPLESAKKSLGILSRREGFGPGSQVWWSLPPPIEHPEPHRAPPRVEGMYGVEGDLCDDSGPVEP